MKSDKRSGNSDAGQEETDKEHTEPEVLWEFWVWKVIEKKRPIVRRVKYYRQTEDNEKAIGESAVHIDFRERSF